VAEREGARGGVACLPGSKIGERAAAVGLEVVDLPWRSWLDPRAALFMSRLVRRLEPDIVQTHSSKDSWLSFWLHLAGIPVVRSRNISLRVPMGFFRSFSYRFGCREVVAVSDSIRRSLVEGAGVPPRRVHVVGSGVDLRRFRPTNDGSGFREEFGVPSGAVLFGVVGMLRGEKGQQIFLEAAIGASLHDPSLRFAIVGDAPSNSTLEKRLRKRLAEAFPDGRGPVFMTGFRRDIPEVMAALDVLVVPSLHDAQTLVIPEAFATGRPVIASLVGGVPELVRDGENGQLVPPGDAGALTAAMLGLADNPRRRRTMGQNARALAVVELDFDRKMEQLVAVFRRVRRLPPGCRSSDLA